MKNPYEGWQPTRGSIWLRFVWEILIRRGGARVRAVQAVWPCTLALLQQEGNFCLAIRPICFNHELLIDWFFPKLNVLWFLRMCWIGYELNNFSNCSMPRPSWNIWVPNVTHITHVTHVTDIVATLISHDRAAWARILESWHVKDTDFCWSI